MRSNTRKLQRSDYKGEIRVSWDDPNAGTRYANARCVDISETGVAIHMHQHIAPRSIVDFRIEALKLAGRAIVRHCGKRGAYFRIGLEFSGGLRYAGAA